MYKKVRVMEIPNDKDEIENVISLNNSSVKKTFRYLQPEEKL